MDIKKVESENISKVESHHVSDLTEDKNDLNDIVNEIKGKKSQDLDIFNF